MNIQFDEALQIIRIEANDITFESLKETVVEIMEFNDSGIHPVLVDRSQPTTELLDWVDISSAKEYTQALKDILQGRKVATVVDSNIRYAVGRQIQAMGEIVGSAYRYQSFYSEDEAIEWLLSEN